MNYRKTALGVLLLTTCFLFSNAAFLPAASDERPESDRVNLWVDLYRGEPLSYEAVLDDLAEADVIYLGEYHTIARHHDIQRRILVDLAWRKKSLVLALEQLESFNQPEADRYNRGEIGFDELAAAVDWQNRWSNYKQYRPVIEAAKKASIPILALNARAETIRKIARSGGVDRLDRKTRSELPADIQLDDPSYKKRLSLQMMVHAAAGAETLRPMMEAQIARDEAMASTLCEYLKSDAGRGRTAVVLCGAAHVSFGQGTASRVRRRLPEAKDRIVLLSASGDVVISERMQAVSRPTVVTHEQLREIDRPIGDYLNITSLKKADEADAEQ